MCSIILQFVHVVNPRHVYGWSYPFVKKNKDRQLGVLSYLPWTKYETNSGGARNMAVHSKGQKCWQPWGFQCWRRMMGQQVWNPQTSLCSLILRRPPLFDKQLFVLAASLPDLPENISMQSSVFWGSWMQAFLAGNGMDIPSVGFIIFCVCLAWFWYIQTYHKCLSSFTTKPGFGLLGAHQHLDF